MEKRPTEKLTEFQQDALNEISSITSSNASTALSDLVGKKVDINIPKAEFLTLEDLTESLGGRKKIAMSIYLKVRGDIGGQSLFLFERGTAMKLTDFILKDNKQTHKVMDHFTESAFGEMANIFTAAYLNALAHLFSLRIIPDVPVVAGDYLGPMLEYVFGKVDNPSKKTLCFSTQIEIEGERIDGSFIFILDKSSQDLLVDKLKTNYGLKDST